MYIFWFTLNTNYHNTHLIVVLLSITCTTNTIAPITHAPTPITQPCRADEHRAPLPLSPSPGGPGVVRGGEVEYDPRDDGQTEYDQAVCGLTPVATTPHWSFHVHNHKLSFSLSLTQMFLPFLFPCLSFALALLKCKCRDNPLLLYKGEPTCLGSKLVDLIFCF